MKPHVELDELHVALLEVIEDLIAQGCEAREGEYLDYGVSSYEDAMSVLAELRPDRWMLTKRGILMLPPA